MIAIKRDGRRVEFEYSRIVNAVAKAVEAVYGEPGSYENVKQYERIAETVAFRVHMECNKRNESDVDGINVEEIQDLVEDALMCIGEHDVAKAYIIYRDHRSKVRDANTHVMQATKEIIFTDSIDSDIKRENGNVDTDGPMGKMLKQGGETGKAFSESFLIKPEHTAAHREGDIHIHDQDFYDTGTQTCCQIDAVKLLEGGFSTGHGYLREPNHIKSYSALACIAIQANQNSQHK